MRGGSSIPPAPRDRRHFAFCVLGNGARPRPSGPAALPYQGQLFSELDNHTLVRSGQGDEVKHDKAVTEGREVTRELVPSEGRWKNNPPRSFSLQQSHFC